MVELIDYDIFHTHEILRTDSQNQTLMDEVDDNWSGWSNTCHGLTSGTCEYHQISKYQEVLVYKPNKPRVPCNAYLKCVSKSTLANLKMKTYIKSGEICKICFEPITSRHNARLTNCGHSFHKKCMNDYYIYLLRFQPNLDIWCPLCRGDVGMLEVRIGDFGLQELCLRSSRRLVVDPQPFKQ